MTTVDTNTVIAAIEEKLTQALTANFVVHDRGETHLDMFANYFEDEIVRTAHWVAYPDRQEAISNLEIYEFNESDVGLGVDVSLSGNGEISITTRLRESRDEWHLEEHEITPVLKAIEKLAVTAIEEAHRQAVHLETPDRAPEKKKRGKSGPRFGRSATLDAVEYERTPAGMAI